MICKSILITLLVSVMQAQAKEHEKINRDDAQHFMDAVTNNVINVLFLRELKASQINHSLLDGTMLGKPGSVAVSPCKSLDSRSGPLSSKLALFQVRGFQSRHARNIFCVGHEGTSQLSPIAAYLKPRQVLYRRSIGSGMAAALLAAIMGPSLPANSIGPESFPLEVVAYDDITCPQGVPTNARCINVRAEAKTSLKKPGYNGEVFGRVRFENGESAIYGDFAEASDAGKIGDIVEVPAGNPMVSFMLKLQREHLEDKLKFANMKVRIYPGMRANFRVAKPVTETCDPEIESCLDDLGDIDGR
eukprot:gnl/MRDRNA2_/MRDRNA2_66228_c0_seq1.p1 gnl/MRDRNA2_/MRDRNA2_66228_c0~~gnl/MRDRNA2_/MRDRNA2_66228_c0_seq1.p1  ORF type:complete len:303 (-),score=47.47 gnl/MRDRNA2_/MRDRNA2_66228_c0_seq1:506-1414(-)